MKKLKAFLLTAIGISVLSFAACRPFTSTNPNMASPDTIAEEESAGPVKEEPKPVKADTITDQIISQIQDEPFPSSEESQAPAPDYYGSIDLTSRDINGTAVDASDFTDQKLIMVNFWEPWCGPCVREMPDLQRLYDDYKDQGFVVVGIYSTLDMSQEAQDILSELGITYPVLEWNSSYEDFLTGYVPTTVFADGNGNVLSEEPYIGGRSYEDWEDIILNYL